MRLSIICVGRLKAGQERELFERYAKRFTALGRQIGLGSLNLIELPESRAGQASARQTEEARAIVMRCPDNAVLVLLDERGKSLSSTAFAEWIGAERDAGAAGICFAIGGPDGHGAPARAAARMAVNMGRMTLSHGLARVVLGEQLYRAATILAGHPYHRQ